MTYFQLRLPVALLASAYAALAMPIGQARAIDVGVSVNAGDAGSADAGASFGGGSGIDAAANASLGGSNGVSADAAADAGGRRGVNADLNAHVSGSDGVDAAVSIGGGINAKLAIGRVNGRSDAATTSGGATDAAEVRTLEAFRNMPADQRRKMLVRCADISGSGGSDSGLAGLCSLLQASASR
ncbi:hypothetical protein HJB72_17095 [Rhizobium lentis]|uniref:hypothetical protein n=1 Tax=Rhizobium lentis TaxID=1138194 RepID=UPI001C834934|nr:hypothetical protein [Rhizobium lentis]MBX4999668.1 hypothetical protein [Rhizobium lentis]